jgi:hypothetical protein
LSDFWIPGVRNCIFTIQINHQQSIKSIVSCLMVHFVFKIFVDGQSQQSS